MIEKTDKPSNKSRGQPKYQSIYEYVCSEIQSGRYLPGQRLPSELELSRRFSTSRPTVIRALRDLQHHGLLERRAGSGSYVLDRSRNRTDSLGLLVPGLGRPGIFQPICAEIARVSQASNYGLLWGDITEGDLDTCNKQAERVCRLYIDRKVAGVFFEPLELLPEKDEINERIAAALAGAGIPVVLLDRDLRAFPARSALDLVGVDNRLVGHTLADHLLGLGCRRIEFVGRAGYAPTVEERIRGFQESLRAHGIGLEGKCVHRGDPSDPAFVHQLMETGGVEAFICANDDDAVDLIISLAALGIRVPQDVRVVGVDDVHKYSRLLPVPLTTIHQPCREMGAVAVKTLLDRIAFPDQPPRDIRLGFKLMVRESCGGNLAMGGTRAEGH